MLIESLLRILSDSFIVRPDLPVRQHARILLASPCQYSGFENDDDIHEKRSRPELFEIGFG